MCGEYVLHSLEQRTHAGHPGRTSLWSVEKMTRYVTKRSQHNGRPCSGKNVSNTINRFTLVFGGDLNLATCAI